ncbi:unnamed protein product, partial [Symbiodinium sp. KB8]
SAVCSIQHCADGVLSGDETCVDGGGSCPSGCAPGSACLVASDCREAESVCADARCTVPPNCSNGRQDAGEVAADVGPVCGPTAVGGACSGDSQCASGRCVLLFPGAALGTCGAGTCSDGIWQRDREADMDCGASCGRAALCPVYSRCSGAGDCTSGRCVAGVCVPSSSCEPGQCGGGCAPCPLESKCSLASDCMSGWCASGVCARTSATPESSSPALGSSASGALDGQAGLSDWAGGSLQQSSFLVDEGAVMQSGVPFVSSLSPSSGPAGGGSSVRFLGGDFAVAPSTVYRCVAVDPTTRRRLQGSLAGACLAPRDAFVECQVPLQDRGSAMLALEYSALGSPIGPWERAQAFFVDTGAFFVTGRRAVATGLRVDAMPGVLVQGGVLSPEPQVSLVDDFGAVVAADSSTVVRMRVLLQDGRSVSEGLEAVGHSAEGGTDVLAARANLGVVSFGHVRVAVGGGIIGTGVRIAFSAEGCDGVGAFGLVSQPLRALAASSHRVGSMSHCTLRDVAGECCSPPAVLDDCGLCSGDGTSAAAACGIRVDLPLLLSQAATTGSSGQALQWPADVLLMIEASLRTVVGYTVTTFRHGVVGAAGTSAGIPITAPPAGSRDWGLLPEPPQLGATVSVVVSLVVPPPQTGWTAQGALSRRQTELRLLEAARNATSSVYGAGSAPARAITVAPDLAHPSAALVPEALCDLAPFATAPMDCELLAADPEGFTSNVSLAATNCSTSQENATHDSGGPDSFGEEPKGGLDGFQTWSSPADESLAVIHAAVVGLAAFLALVQRVWDAVRASCGKPALHAGPGSAIAGVLPSIAVIGMGVLDLAEHGHFALLLSQIHGQSPPVVRRTGELMVASTGLIPGLWGVLEPLLRPGASATQAAGAGEPLAIRVLATTLGTPADGLMSQAAVTLAASLALVLAFHGALLLVSSFSSPGEPLGRSTRAARSPSDSLALASRVHRREADESGRGPGGFSGTLSLLQMTATALVGAVVIMFGATSLVALHDIEAPASAAGYDGRRAGGWVAIGTVLVGFSVVIASCALVRQPMACCPGPCSRMWRAHDAVAASPHQVHAYEGRGARVLDPTARAGHEAASGRSWLIARHVDRIVTAGLLIWLAARPGAQAAAIVAKQVLLLTALLALRPTRSPTAWLAELVVVGGRVVLLLLSLAFVSPAEARDLEVEHQIGVAVVVLQILLALLMLALVVVRFPAAARLAAQCSGVARTAAGSAGSVKEPSLRFAAVARGVPSKIRKTSRREASRARSASSQQELSMHSNPMASAPISPDAAVRAGPSPSTRALFAPLDIGGGADSDDQDLIKQAGSGGRLAEHRDTGPGPADLLDKDAVDAAARAGRMSVKPADNPMLSPRRLKTSQQ